MVPASSRSLWPIVGFRPWDTVRHPSFTAHCQRTGSRRAASLLIGDPERFIDDEVQFRQFYCPACGGLIENEVCRAQDPLL